MGFLVQELGCKIGFLPSMLQQGTSRDGPGPSEPCFLGQLEKAPSGFMPGCYNSCDQCTPKHGGVH